MIKNEKINEPDAHYDQLYTYEDYLNFSFDDSVEIIRGKIFRMSPAPGTAHQKISRNFGGLLYNHLKGKRCQYSVAPFDVILPVKGKDFMHSDRVVKPDLVVVCNPDYIKEKGCFGVPDWIIEILSPHTTKKDLQDKFDLYEESGVNEYWIVEPRNKTVEVFILEEGTYRRVTAYVIDDLIPCYTLPELTIDLREIFEDEPDVTA
ncbi:MAG: Uma2 family endonuclease [Saprospiraceae bacterium]|nr:Uma2 family endonuclease [Saprospiraceae bacterium]